MREINRKIIAALIFSSDGKIFQGMKDPDKGGVYFDCWHIPGGGVDSGETDREALEREIIEETGIDIRGLEIELIDDKGKGQSEKILKTGEKVLCNMDFIVYKVQLNALSESIKIILNDDLVKYAWRNIDDLKDIKLTPPSVDLFKRLGYI